jgi:hypothetical protein
MNSDSDKKEIWAVNQYPVELKSFLSGQLCNSIADGDEGYSYGELIGIGWQAATASMQEEIDRLTKSESHLEGLNYRLNEQIQQLQAEVERLQGKTERVANTETVQNWLALPDKDKAEWFVLSMRREKELRAEVEALKGQWINYINKRPEYGQAVILKINGVVQEMTWMRDGADDTADWFEPNFADHYEDNSLKFFAHTMDDLEWMALPESEPPKTQDNH